jgi:ubiquinol-cytochrome c reductase cytochrome c subunit
VKMGKRHEGKRRSQLTWLVGSIASGAAVLALATIALYPHQSHPEALVSAKVAPVSKKASKPTAHASSSGQPIVYKNPPRNLIPQGRQLFAEDCQTCHGPDAEGSVRAPDLQGLGAGTVDFWVATGRMPLADPTEQAAVKPPRLSHEQQLAVSAYVASLAPGGVAIPSPNLGLADLSKGESLFAENCAACHTITGAGDELSNNIYAPTLWAATPTEVAEAIRSGPGDMPRFGPGTFSNQEVDDIVRYVTYIQHPEDRGGLGLGGVGPVAEGFVAILIGLGSLMVAGYWIGGRAHE